MEFNQIKHFKLLNAKNNGLLVTESSDSNVELDNYIKFNLNEIERNLIENGAILFRNFSVKTIENFQEVSSMFTDELLDYSHRSSPRTNIDGKVFSSTEYPPDFYIPLHNESSYSKNWPDRILFFCVTPPEYDGETPIADSRTIFKNLDKSVVKKFKEKGVMYVRNFHNNIGMSWEEVFQVSSKEECERYCLDNDIHFEWLESGILQTYNICNSTTTHPITLEEVWFNQAHLFSVYSFEEEIRNQLFETFSSEMLPRNAFYGDGTNIEQSIIEEIMSVYKEHTIKFAWKKSDLLLLDNILFSHGRMPFKGERKIVVTMGNKSL